MKLLSDQVSEEEIKIILRELDKTENIAGSVVEFGCYVGTTSVFLGKKIQDWNKKQKLQKDLYLYDSFEGLPEKNAKDISPIGVDFKKGELATTKTTLIKNLKKNGIHCAYIKKGWFSDLKDKDVPETISFAYLDGDYYDSIFDPLNLIWAKISDGGIVVVDDYSNEALPGAAIAVKEFFKNKKVRIKNEKSLAIIQKP